MKAANRKKRRAFKFSNGGRPRKGGMIRTDNGRISRSEEQEAMNAQEAKEVVILARIRQAAIHGEVIEREEAESPLYGYCAGRKAIAGDFGKVKKVNGKVKLSELAASRLQTGNDVAANWNACHINCGYPPMNSQAMNFGKAKGIAIEGINAQERGRKAEAMIMRYIGILGTIHPGAHGIFRRVFLADDETAEYFTPHMNDLLVKSLDALAKG